MALGDRIKECRQKANLSQEKVAELVGVSRQAVTKWEANQSAPSTENLFKLAELFGTSVDFILSSNDTKEKSIAEQVIELYKAEEKKKQDEKRKMWVRRIGRTLLVACGYLAFYLFLRVLFVPLKDMTVKAWLVTTSPYDIQDYLYGWLLNANWFLNCTILSAVLCVVGKTKLSYCTFAGFILGYVLGDFLGPNPEGAAMGQGHYGWAIWSVTFLFSVVVGIIIEKRCEKQPC